MVFSVRCGWCVIRFVSVWDSQVGRDVIRAGMFIDSVPNRTSPPAVLLRESYLDEQGRAQKRTLATSASYPVTMA
jgi:hypothetical protein